MALIPAAHNAQIAFFEQHIDGWEINAASIGLTTTQTTQLATLIEAARNTYDAAQAARNASKAATASADDKRDAMRTFGADIIATIKAFAEASRNPAVYQIAEIPAPAPPSPIGAPDVPSDIRGVLDSDGAITLRWFGTRTGGTMWTIQRQVSQTVDGPYTPWALLGTAGERVFKDETLPAGIAKAAYRIKAMRSPGGESDWSSAFTMSLGVVPQGSAQQGKSGGGLSLAA